MRSVHIFKDCSEGRAVTVYSGSRKEKSVIKDCDDHYTTTDEGGNVQKIKVWAQGIISNGIYFQERWKETGHLKSR